MTSESIDRYYECILHYCKYHLYPFMEQAQECTQDIFVAYVQVTKSTQIRDPKSWLYRTADNYIRRFRRDSMRKKSLIVSLSIKSDADIESGRFSYDPDFEELGHEDDLPEYVRKVLSALSEKERKLYTLRFQECRSLKELSQIYEISLPAIKNRVCRLKKHIRKIADELFNH